MILGVTEIGKVGLCSSGLPLMTIVYSHTTFMYGST